MIKWCYLMAGGLLGTLGRYVFSGWVCARLGSGFPYGTFAVNILGCFLVGLFSMWIDHRQFVGPQGRYFLMIGFCGAFTTFSTYMLETHHLLQEGELLKVGLNIFLSTGLGFLAFILGVWCGKWV